MTDEGQHRISQVYLKQFGFKDKNEHWRISVYEKGNPVIHSKFIKSFTKETNIFDVKTFNEEIPEIRRYFERNSKLLEDHYSRVIKGIEENNQVGDFERSILLQFAPNLLCRTEQFRSLIELFLHPLTRDQFFKEITMFSEDKIIITFLKAISPTLPINEQINLIIGSVMNHLVTVFETFNMVVLKDFDGRGWFTTDNPVTLDTAKDYNWIVPLATEVYFPLSRNYCLFMYNPNVTRDNELRNVEHGRIIKATGEIHDMVSRRIASNASRYLIFPYDMGQVNPKA